MGNAAAECFWVKYGSTTHTACHKFPAQEYFYVGVY
jgi:hypothetical protein